jgi:hypothetical protein
MDDAHAALAAELTALYLPFHRRRRKGELRLASAQGRGRCGSTSRGPLTVGEAARDRRRVPVWLGDAGQAHLAREQQVLDVERLAAAAGAMSAADAAVSSPACAPCRASWTARTKDDDDGEYPL